MSPSTCMKLCVFSRSPLSLQYFSTFEHLSELVLITQALEQEVASLQVELEQLIQKKTSEELTSSSAQLEEHQAQ